MSGCVLIAGASRGLGAEFVRQYAADGWRALAAMRRPAAVPPGAEMWPLDVDDAGSVTAATVRFAGEIDLLVVCAGLMGPKTEGFASPAEVDFEQLMRTNVLAPIRLIEAFAPGIAARRGAIAVLTSHMGSIGHTASAYGLAYRCSKAAANMAVKAAAETFGRQGARIVALDPGWVRTDMGGPQAPLDAETSVRGLRAVIAGLAAKDNATFIDYRGQRLPW